MSLKKLIKTSINKIGLDIIKSKSNTYQIKKLVNKPLFEKRLQNLKNQNFKPTVIIDGGAHIGGWTKTVSKYYPNSKYILIEPNPMVSSKINQNLHQNTDYTILNKALGTQKGVMELNIWEDKDTNLTGSSLCNHIQGDANKKISCEIIDLDSLITIYNKKPDLVKLDLQGFELNALKGAKEILKHTEVFIIEFSCLDAYIERTSIDELIIFMYNNNYSLYDIVDLHYRPYDNALTGGDFIFVKNTSDLKSYKGWD